MEGIPVAATLAQIVGVEQGVRSAVEQWWKLVRDAIRNDSLLVGIEKHYDPLEGGIDEPDEIRRIQINPELLLAEARDKLGRYLDITATKDWGNMGEGGARADVEVDGVLLLHDVPATYLLFLEKRLAELHADLKKIPVQSAAEVWQPTTDPGVFRTEAVRAPRLRKQEHYEVIGVTKEHPGHLVKSGEDVIAGYTTTVKLTTAPTRQRMSELLDRIATLREAVQIAIHDANKIVVDDIKVSGEIFGYIFEGATNGAKR